MWATPTTPLKSDSAKTDSIHLQGRTGRVRGRCAAESIWDAEDPEDADDIDEVEPVNTEFDDQTRVSNPWGGDFHRRGQYKGAGQDNYTFEITVKQPNFNLVK